MKIHLVDIPELPFVAALFSARGTLLAHTPEWKEGQDAAVSYPIRNQKLLVSPNERDRLPQGAKVAILLLLEALREAASKEDVALRTRLTMLSSSLDVVLGKVANDLGTIQDLVEALSSGSESR
ncbi:MAG: hypothetical protein ACREF7_03300, partial [Candidatus Saccharimonadales bacterium]